MYACVSHAYKHSSWGLPIHAEMLATDVFLVTQGVFLLRTLSTNQSSVSDDDLQNQGHWVGKIGQKDTKIRNGFS